MNRFAVWAIALLTVVLTGCQAALSDADLEAKVIDIIRRKPEVILESVQAYQQRQSSAAQSARDRLLAQFQEAPAVLIQDSPVLGESNRPVVLAEFSDFQCPFCARAKATVDEFMAKHGGEVALTFKHFPLSQIHPEALPAAKAARAAQNQGKFWEYHDRLFARQKELGETLYTNLAAELGLDREQFERDRQSAETTATINRDLELGRALGIEGTPFFLMNGRPLAGAVSLAELEQLLEQVRP
ncbi:MAG: thioredoxin domain-containing protein [Pseudanabaenaceae cyanobacterium]